MIKLTVLYPNTPGAHFDMDYYLEIHLPFVKSKLGSYCKGCTVTRGISAAITGTKPPYLAWCDISFESVEAFESSFLPHAPEFRADHENYTNVVPERQLSDILHG
ncbi:MAG: EthD family reductase [Comamonadaceae bacterium]|nr:MAG: EthD family reductase [Comamonadaceae bacterium]